MPSSLLPPSVSSPLLLSHLYSAYNSAASAPFFLASCLLVHCVCTWIAIGTLEDVCHFLLLVISLACFRTLSGFLSLARSSRLCSRLSHPALPHAFSSCILLLTHSSALASRTRLSPLRPSSGVTGSSPPVALVMIQLFVQPCVDGAGRCGALDSVLLPPSQMSKETSLKETSLLSDEYGEEFVNKVQRITLLTS
jgi:hypothetical protein